VDRDRKKDMKKKITLLTLCAMLFALCSFAQAQQSGKIFRIGFLDQSTVSGSAVLVDAFRQELSKLGWIEEKNITIEYRFAEQKNERVPELAAELVRLKVDLIVATTTPSALVAKSATTTIPIVMVSAVDPVSAGLVAQSGPASRQCHRALGFIDRAGHEKARDTQRRGSQARPSWISAVGRRHRTRKSRTERSQTCGCGTEAEIGGDRDSN
jgi:ABC transporter substrate binding protein